MPDKHALLSASSAARWLNCPPSVRLTENMPDTESIYAKEGTLAHEMCEIKLSGFIAPVPKRTITTKLNKLKKSELYQPEMDTYTDVYVNYVKKLAMSFDSRPGMFVEKQVDYSNYVPDGFGTSDCIIVCGKNLHIIDFKYGKGVPVSAEDNPQMKLYALGAVNLYQMFYPIKQIHLSIIQPRLDNISEWKISLEDLLSWGESIKSIAQLAYDGKGEFKSGAHCKFCKIASTCRKRAEENLQLAQYEFAKPASTAKEGEATLSDSEVGQVLSQAQELKKWVEDLEKYALEAVLNGNKIDGWKAVEGRGSRSWSSDSEEIEHRLSSLGYPSSLAYERKILSVAQLEKVIGKDGFENFSDLFEKSKGKPALAPKSDKRPEYVQGTTATEDFK